MLPTEQLLSQIFVTLFDAELLARLRSGNLTATAVAMIERELAARGIAAERPPPERPPAANDSFDVHTGLWRVVRFLLQRVLLFPINGITGSEPLWAVVVFGGGVMVAAYKLAVLGVSDLVFTQPASTHAATLSYALLSVYALTSLWFGAALWRSAARARPPLWKILARLLGVVIALNCLAGSVAAARLVHQYLPPASDGRDLMEGEPQR